MNLGIEGAWAVVTGGSRGIGAAVVEALIREGASVTVLSRTKPPLGEWTETDMTDPESVSRAFFPTSSGPDILINAVGGKATADVSAMDLNYRATRLAIGYAMPTMKKGSSIVNIASINGIEPSGDSDYSASKAAIIGLTKSMSRVLAPFVRVNCVAPGSVDGPRRREWAISTPERHAQIISEIPMGRLGTPEEVARVVVFMASCPWVTGACWVVDGGRTWSI